MSNFQRTVVQFGKAKIEEVNLARNIGYGEWGRCLDSSKDRFLFFKLREGGVFISKGGGTETIHTDGEPEMARQVRPIKVTLVVEEL